MSKPTFTCEMPAMDVEMITADQRAGVQQSRIVSITPYLCPHCPRVHLNIDFNNNSTVACLFLTDKQADDLAAGLMNPVFMKDHE